MDICLLWVLFVITLRSLRRADHSCVAVCDLETSWIWRPWHTGGCRAKNKQTKHKSHKILWLHNVVPSLCLFLSFYFLWRHITPEWYTSQLRYLEFRGLDKILNEITPSKNAYWVAQLFATFPYKAEGRRFDSRWGSWDFYWRIHSGHTTAVGPTQFLIEMSTRGISWGVKAAGE